MVKLSLIRATAEYFRRNTLLGYVTFSLLCGLRLTVTAQIGGGSDPDITPTVADTDVSSFIGTGSGYDAWTGSARRQVVDFEVPGAVSQHGLKWERTYSSSGGWSFAYTWRLYARPWPSSFMDYPDGRHSRFEVGTKERQFGDPGQYAGNKYVYLEDGSYVTFDRWTELNGNDTYLVDHITPLSITDRYGRVIDLYWELMDTNVDHIHLKKITDRATGKWIEITYGLGPGSGISGYATLPTHVQGSDGHYVDYFWTQATDPLNGGVGGVLTHVAYSDATVADYGYAWTPYGINSNKGKFCMQWARDNRFAGSMQSVWFDYKTTSKWPGQVLTEKHLNLSNNTGDVTVSSFLCNSVPGPTVPPVTQTETRGDGPSRTIKMKELASGHGPAFTTEKSDFNGVVEKYGYNANFWLNQITDRRNNITNFTLESNVGNPTRKTHPDGTHIDYTYSDAFYPYFVASVADERGNMTSYSRNPPITDRLNPNSNPNVINQITHPDGGVEIFTYNTFGQITKHQLPSNSSNPSIIRYVHYRYDATTHLLTDEWEPTTSSTQVETEPKTTYVYYTATDVPAWQNRVKSKTPPANAGGLINKEVYYYDRTLDASPVPKTDQNGTAVAGRGLVTRIDYPNDTHPTPFPNGSPLYSIGTFKAFGYDQFGNKVYEDNEWGQRTTYVYDEYKRLKTTTLPSPAGTTVNDYSPVKADTLACYKHTTNSIYFVTDPVNFVAANVYDVNWNQTSTTLGYGNAAPNVATTWFQYDANRNQTKVTDPRGTGTGDPNYTTTTGYDTRNRKTSVTDPQNHVTGFYYDDNLNVTRIVRADGSTESKHYNPMNRVDSDTMPKAGPPTAPTETITTTFVYNKSGSLRSVTVPQSASINLTTSFEYELSDLKTKITYSNSTDTQQWFYDNAKNLTSRQTVSGKTQSFTYDSRDRKMGMTWSNGADSATLDYDKAGRLITANNPTSNVTRDYDAAGRLILDRQSVGSLGSKDVQYGYDATSKQTRLYLTSAGYDYTFDYDPMVRFWTIKPTGSSASFTYSYDVASNETQRLNNINSVAQVYSRDNLSRMSRRDLKIGATTFAYEIYGYDSMSRMTSIDREDGLRDGFTYYLNSELNIAKYGPVSTPTRTVNYTVDKSGNRTNVNDTGVNTSYTPNNLNQYTGVGGPNNVGNGSEHEISSFQTNTYTYINDERLKSIMSGANNYNLAYDALGRCVSRTLNGTTYYIYDGEKPIVEYSSAGVINAKNLYGKAIDEILMRTDPTVNGGQPFYYQQDHEGNVTQLTNGTGGIIENYRYDVFGKPTINGGALTSSAFNNRFMFTGREYATTFGVYEYRARAYNPTLGRFMSEDPKGFDPGEYNLFRYCKNDPTDSTDPMGLDTLVIWNEWASGSGNVFGHIAIATTGQGLHSVGNNPHNSSFNYSHSSVTDYLAGQATTRNTSITVIKTTPQEEAIINRHMDALAGKISGSAFDNCAVRVSNALHEANPKFATSRYPEVVYKETRARGQGTTEVIEKDHPEKAKDYERFNPSNSPETNGTRGAPNTKPSQTAPPEWEVRIIHDDQQRVGK